MLREMQLPKMTTYWHTKSNSESKSNKKKSFKILKFKKNHF